MRARKQVRKFLCSIWAVGIFAAATALAQNPSTPAATPDQSSAQQADTEPYRVGVGDVLTIMVWKEPELSGSVVVRPDGAISLPLVNDVRVVGLTPHEVQELLTEKLKPFITAAQVTVKANPPSDHLLKPRNLPDLLPPLWPFVVG
jgi:polysaccharide export outer membrane protein